MLSKKNEDNLAVRYNKQDCPRHGIGVKINFESKANKINCNEKPDPQGNAHIQRLTTLTFFIELNKVFS